MKKTIFAFIVLCILWIVAPAARAQTPSSAAPSAAPDAKELTQLLNDFLAGAGRNDATLHDRFWADDLIYTSATGTRRGKAEIMRNVRNPVPEPGPATIYSAEEIRIQQYGSTAIVAFRLVATPSPAAPNAPAQAAPPAVQRFFNTGTFLKRNGEWRVVAWQATRIPDATPAQPK